MKYEWKALISDTITFLKQEGIFSESVLEPVSNPLNTSKKENSPQILPIETNSTERRQETPDPNVRVKEKKDEPYIPKKEIPTSFLEAIQKHLPSVELIPDIPSPVQVGILIENGSDLMFVKKLAEAIEDRFCGVKIFSQKTEKNLNSFDLLLTEQKIPNVSLDKQWIVPKWQTLQTDPAQKKLLWSQICHLLSPKFS